MSFKSKQRAKHGHLFGDDPLSASLVSTSDDPLFGSKKTTVGQSNKSSPVIANDPLSRLMSNDSNPLESSSTPISTTNSRRKGNGNMLSHSQSSSISSHSGSIFGDIDVSKLGTGSSFSNSKKTNSTSLRSSATLKSSKMDLDEEEDLLFGGHRHSPSKSKLSQKSTTNTSTNTFNPDSLSPSPILSNALASPLLPPVNNSSISSAPKKSPILTSNVLSTPIEPTIKENNHIPKAPVQSIPAASSKDTKVTKTAEDVKKEEKPTVSSSTSSFFKFFKSGSQQNSKTSSSASSAASVRAASPTVEKDDVVNPPIANNTTKTTTTPKITNIDTNTNSLPAPRETVAQPNQPKSNNIYKNIKQIITKERPVEAEEEEEVEDTRPPVILDEATRAFAEDDLFSTPKNTASSNYDYRSLSPELTMDALTINPDSNKKLNASISTPTRVDDPWSETSLAQNFIVEPSISSPLVVKVQDIEPQKRSAFADLIQSWNTGNSTSQEFIIEKNDPNTFYEHIAEERRDIGFAGIDGSENTDRESNNASSMVDWTVEEDNPWN